MIEYERETYRRWLASPDFVLSSLTRAFAPERRERRWESSCSSAAGTRCHDTDPARIEGRDRHPRIQ